MSADKDVQLDEVSTEKSDRPLTPEQEKAFYASVQGAVDQFQKEVEKQSAEHGIKVDVHIYLDIKK